MRPRSLLVFSFPATFPAVWVQLWDRWRAVSGLTWLSGSSEGGSNEWFMFDGGGGK